MRACISRADAPDLQGLFRHISQRAIATAPPAEHSPFSRGGATGKRVITARHNLGSGRGPAGHVRPNGGRRFERDRASERAGPLQLQGAQPRGISRPFGAASSCAGIPQATPQGPPVAGGRAFPAARPAVLQYQGALALESLSAFEARPDSADRPEIPEYRRLISDLEAEVTARLDTTIG